MKENRDRQEHLNDLKILFFIVTRINGEYKRIDINTEENQDGILQRRKRR